MKALGLFVAVAFLIAARAPAARVAGIDHVPVAVADLEAAAARFRQLGFVLKPGRPHANGIRNVHAKFPDGTEIELITAPEGVDPLTRRYREHLRAGDGPAFLALFVRAGPVPASPEGPLSYLFFGGRQASPTDRPEHFAHANGATSLRQVWLAGGDLSRERRLLSSLGARMREGLVEVPDPVRATIADFDDGAIVMLPDSRQLVPGRPIVGMTVAVRDIRQTRAVVGTGELRGRSLFLPPATAAGFWLEFRQR